MARAPRPGRLSFHQAGARHDFHARKLQALRERFGGANEAEIHDPHFRAIAANVINDSGTRMAPYAGMPTLLDAPARAMDWSRPEFGDLEVALLGVPMDLGASNRSGCRFGPRALRAIERVGPYNHVLKCTPVTQLRVADIGDVPMRSRFSLDQSHEDIEAIYRHIQQAGVIPLSAGGDHSVTLPILRALGRERPLALIHFDAHCDTGGPFDGSRFHHGGPFRQAVLDGVLDPTRTIQIGIRGAAEYLWEFSYASGMTVIHAEDIPRLGVDAIVAQAREVVGDAPVYVSFDIDCLDPACARHRHAGSGRRDGARGPGHAARAGGPEHRRWRSGGGGAGLRRHRQHRARRRADHVRDPEPDVRGARR